MPTTQRAKPLGWKVLLVASPNPSSDAAGDKAGTKALRYGANGDGHMCVKKGGTAGDPSFVLGRRGIFYLGRKGGGVLWFHRL